MYRPRLLALIALVAGLALAQTTDSHTVSVNIPSVLSLQIDATDFLFDFSDATLTGTEAVTVNGTPYTKASLAAYDAFIDTATGTQVFAPTKLAGAPNDYATATVRTNRATWTVNISSIGGTLASPLDNGRVSVFAEKASGKGASWTSVPTPITAGSPLTLFSANSGGQGKSVYKREYLDRGLYPRAYAILLALPDYLPQEEAEAVLGLRKALMERWTPRASAPAKELEVVL